MSGVYKVLAGIAFTGCAAFLVLTFFTPTAYTAAVYLAMSIGYLLAGIALSGIAHAERIEEYDDEESKV